MSKRARGPLAATLNALVLAPALAIGDGGSLASATFFVLVSLFAWLEARGGETIDLSDDYPWAALATALATLGLFWLASVTASPRASIASVVGGAIAMSVGVALRHLAMAGLGSGFVSEVRVAPRLVEGGIYRRMRHPSELGLLALTLGAAVLFGSPAAVIAWALVLVPLVLVRVRREDRELRTCFGSVHVDYCRRVGAFW